MSALYTSCQEDRDINGRYRVPYSHPIGTCLTSCSLKPEAFWSALHDSGLSCHCCVDAWRVLTDPKMCFNSVEPSPTRLGPHPLPLGFFDDLLPFARTSQFRPTNSVDEGPHHSEGTEPPARVPSKPQPAG